MKLFARICNQPQRLSVALAPVRAALIAQPPVSRWGLGYIQGGDVLLVRPPKPSATPGDLAGPSAPVLSMLPDGAVKLRLYLPEESFSAVTVGSLLDVHCDGCKPGLTARVSYVSPDPEFTPPVIYSLETRQKLVFLIEARPEGEASPLQPGQIVDVGLAAGK